MTRLNLLDAATRSNLMASKPKRWRPKSEMKNVGGEKGKLHREIGVPEVERIPKKRLHAAAHSKNPEIKRDAIRAETMSKWKKPKRLRDVYTKKD